jgi:hypothetical protein
MSEQLEIHTTLEEFQGVSQKLRLTCRKCGDRADYDVGAICCDPGQEGESGGINYTFANYFRCRKCGGPGPWEIVDRWKVLRMAARATLGWKSENFRIARCVMFDGSVFQTPAMGEEHLLSLTHKEPDNAFLHTRLVNLFRNCGHDAKAAEWFEKALRLDANDLEARHSLFLFATTNRNQDDAKIHAMALVRSLLDGHRTKSDGLTEGLAASLVENLRGASPSLRGRLLGTQMGGAASREEIFIRSLLAEEGDEETIVSDAVEWLLPGSPEPSHENDASDSSEESATLLFDPIPSLQALVATHGLNPRKLTVALMADEQGNIRVCQKHSIPVTDGAKTVQWEVPSLAELFRGNAIPPNDINHYPPDYFPHFFFVEKHFLALCDASKDRTDQEMEDVYSALRRRPDGRSLGAVHDLMWQVAALLLDSHTVSAAEYHALLGALVRSTRKWALRPVSRNYVAYLRKTFPEEALLLLVFHHSNSCRDGGSKKSMTLKLWQVSDLRPGTEEHRRTSGGHTGERSGKTGGHGSCPNWPPTGCWQHRRKQDVITDSADSEQCQVRETVRRGQRLKQWLMLDDHGAPGVGQCPPDCGAIRGEIRGHLRNRHRHERGAVRGREKAQAGELLCRLE